MQIKSVHIKNLRSIANQKIEFDEYNCLVGANGAGKSTVLLALNIFFRENLSSGSELSSLQEEDFHNKNTQEPIEITVEFHKLTNDACEDFQEYVRHGILVVSAIAKFDLKTGLAPVKQYGQRLVMEKFSNFFKSYNDNESAAKLKEIYNGLKAEFNLQNAASKDAMAATLREYESSRPEECILKPSEDQFYGISKGANRLARYVQWVYVPAVKDATDEQLETKNSALGKLLDRAVRSKIDFSDEIEKISQKAREEYKALLATNQNVLDDISTSLAKRLTEWAHPETTLKVEWQQDPRKSVQIETPLAGITAGEGEFEGKLSRFGHGLQRSFLLSLLQELAELNESGPLLILGCEEPELYQHPPQAKHLAQVLKKLSSTNSQIFITTHSPYFITGESFEDVRLAKKVKASSSSQIIQFTNEDFIKRYSEISEKPPYKPAGSMAKINQVLQPALNEMFFCQKLVLVEGLEDVSYIHTWLYLSGKWEIFRKNGIHLVPTNGKSSMIYPLIIAIGMEISTFAIFDGDIDKGHTEKHKADNIKLLKIIGGDHSNPFPDKTVWSDHFIMWSKDMAATIKEEIDGEVWAKASEIARVNCGFAPDIEKNAMFIGELLSNLWDNKCKSTVLDKLCDSILSFE